MILDLIFLDIETFMKAAAASSFYRWYKIISLVYLILLTID